MLEPKNQMGSLILIFITIIIGVTLISALGDEIFSVVNPAVVLNESVDVTAQRHPDLANEFNGNVSTDLDYDGLQSFTELRMANGTVFTRDTDYRVNLTEGELTMLNTSTTQAFQSDNITLADYTHTGDDKYLQGSAVSRTIINNLILIFFVVGLVIWVYVMVKKTWLDQIGQ